LRWGLRANTSFQRYPLRPLHALVGGSGAYCAIAKRRSQSPPHALPISLASSSAAPRAPASWTPEIRKSANVWPPASTRWNHSLTPGHSRQLFTYTRISPVVGCFHVLRLVIGFRL